VDCHLFDTHVTFVPTTPTRGIAAGRARASAQMPARRRAGTADGPTVVGQFMARLRTSSCGGGGAARSAALGY
jgi:hypothetical protein